MKNLASKISSGVAAGVVILVGCVMAGLGLTVVAFLAMFALAAIGLALLARPFVVLSEPQADQEGPAAPGPQQEGVAAA